jgi:hypothetical protein
MSEEPKTIPFVVLPGQPPQPCPELLTEEEAIRYLRLDSDRNPSRTLRYYRERGLLQATAVGRHHRYRRIELDKFLERQTGSGPKFR